jgi:hypothetical protein
MRSRHWRFGFQTQSGDSEAEVFCRCIGVWLFERAWTCVLACVELKGFYMPFATDNAAPESRRGSSVHEEGGEKRATGHRSRKLG